MKQTFPKGFLWGAATSAHQIEGGNTNNDWYAAEIGGLPAGEAGRRSEVACLPARQGSQKTDDGKQRVPVCGLACDSYNRFEEDFDLAVKLGHNAHRLSLEWSRIEAVEGQFSQEAVEHYRKVLLALRQRGLKSFVTLWHFTLPVWVAEMGGWENRKTVDYFCRYVKFCAENFAAPATPSQDEGLRGGRGDLVDFWTILNEPFNIYAPLTRLSGAWPPFKKRALLSYLLVFKHLVEAHRRSYKILKAMTPQTPVGLSENLVYFKPRHPRFFGDHIFVRLCHLITLDLPLRLLSKHLDFIGVNQYFSYEVSSILPSIKPFEERVIAGAMYLILSKLKKYHLSIYITESGVATANDSLRQTFIKDTLGWVEKALSENVDVRGYLHWSLLDNYEWLEGYTKKFGLVNVDFANGQKRTIRESALWLRDFIAKITNNR